MDIIEILNQFSITPQEIGIQQCDSCNKFFTSSAQSQNTCPECIEKSKQLSQNISAIVFPKKIENINFENWLKNTLWNMPTLSCRDIIFWAAREEDPEKKLFHLLKKEQFIEIIEKLFSLIYNTKGIKLYFETITSDGTLSIPKEIDTKDPKVSILYPEDAPEFFPFMLVTENTSDEKITIYPEHSGIVDKVFQDQ